MSTSTPVLLLGGIALVCAGSAVGSLATLTLLGGPVEAAPSPANSSPAGSPLEQRALREAIEALTQQLAARSAGPVRRESQAPTTASDSIEQSGGTGGGQVGADLQVVANSASAPAPAATAGGGNGLLPWVEPPNLDQRALLEELSQNEHKALQKVHLFWDYKKVIARYGAPDEVNGDASMTWFYRDPRSGHTLQFVFCEGVLIAVYQ